MKGAENPARTSNVQSMLSFDEATRPPVQDDKSAPSSVGTLLCATRMRLGKDLQRIAEVLHIRYNFLVAIEDGRYEDLPGQAYAIGFVRAYADHLGLDGDEIVRRYKEESSGIKRKAAYEFPLPSADSGIPSGALLLCAVVVGMLAYGIWYSLAGSDRSAIQLIQEVPDRLAAIQRDPQAPVAATTEAPPATDENAESQPVAPSDTPPAPVETASAEAPAEAAPPPVSAPVPAAAVQPPAPAASDVVELRAKSDIWVTFREPQKPERTQLLKKAEVYRVADPRGTMVLTGSAKDLEILVDGQVVPSGDEGLFTKGVVLDPQRLRAKPPAAPVSSTSP
jgi:cytoskeleton protein RodZ